MEVSDESHIHGGTPDFAVGTLEEIIKSGT